MFDRRLVEVFSRFSTVRVLTIIQNLSQWYPYPKYVSHLSVKIFLFYKTISEISPSDLSQCNNAEAKQTPIDGFYLNKTTLIHLKSLLFTTIILFK